MTVEATASPLSGVRFLTVAEGATIMRVSKMTVYRLVHSGELEAIRVGRSFRVPEQAVNQYLRDAFVGTDRPPAPRSTSAAVICGVGMCPAARHDGCGRRHGHQPGNRARVI